MSNSSADSSHYCALINDTNRKVLNGVIDHLGMLESGTLKTDQKKIGSELVPCHIVHLNTKYYTCDVQVLSYESLEQFCDSHEITKSENVQILALLVCVSQKELTEDFLANLLHFSSWMDQIEVKAFILDENDGGEMNEWRLDEGVLTNFTIARGIEIIKLPVDQKNCLEEDEGLVGIPRVVELIETVQWPNLELKPNPVGHNTHRKHLQQYIESELSDNEEVTIQTFGKTSRTKEKETASDYPNTDDEDAILEWFDKPRGDEIFLPNIRPPHNEITNLQQEQNEVKIAQILGNLNEVRQMNIPLPLLDRVDISEGITYNLLKSMASTDMHNKLCEVEQNKKKC